MIRNSRRRPPAFSAQGLALGLVLLALPVLSAQEKTQEEQRRDTIRYGTETEIASLIGTLKTEGADYLDSDLTSLVNDTRNKNILAGVFAFFAERTKGGLEQRARRAIEERDEEASETILAAIDYLGKLKDPQAVQMVKELLDAEERRFMNAAFRALGRIGGGNPGSASEIAEYLIDYYANRDPGDENRREIVIAVGETGSREGVPFLTDLCANNDERAVVRMAALEALSKIGDDRGLQPILDSITSSDPNVRSTAVAALGPFNGSEVDRAILEAFRDSYWRTRISAAQAAKTRKLTAAVPYLAYRAERDETPNVKDEAIRALGAIGTGEARSVLDKLFIERKNAARVRLLAAEMLTELDGSGYAEQLVIELDEAKRTNQTALYNGFLKIIGGMKSGKLESLAARFFDSGGITEKSYAIDMVANNRFVGLADRVQALTADEKNGGLARKAKSALDKMGISP
ncbi:MAG: HEAT repeat domain-containing protein [Treponema sp.]|jgi:HEAT repeat protein|nr:HEAT repeat domain-containing protein [Treponema sp.]